MITIIIIQSLAIAGFYLVTLEGMIFEPYRNFIYKIIKSDYARKPFIDCPPCMSSIYGTPMYIFLAWGEWNVFEWMIVIFCTAIGSAIVYNIYLMILAIREYFER